MATDTINKIDNLEVERHNTTAESFRELGNAIHNVGTVSLEDLAKATQALGKALNAVPPYTRSSKRINIFRIVKTAVIILTMMSVLLLLANAIGLI